MPANANSAHDVSLVPATSDIAATCTMCTMCTRSFFSVAYKEVAKNQCALNVHNVHFSSTYKAFVEAKKWADLTESARGATTYFKNSNVTRTESADWYRGRRCGSRCC